ncbi:MAG TPA: pitrilysin family protein [Kofleriaceae bacterium]|nr:pitrilysin family protein [Kofleriaceae bacterium]
MRAAPPVITASVPGAPVYVAPSGDTPLVWVEIAIRGGAAADPEGLEGLHRHAALLARRGAGARDRTAFDDDLDRLGAALDVSIARDATTISAVSLTRNLDAVVELCAELLAVPRFAEDEHARLLRETPQVLDEVRDDDSALATRWFDRECAPGHPYGRTSLGTEASLARLDLESARAGWRREVVTSNLVLGVAGDTDLDGALAIARRLTERLPAGPAPALPDVLVTPAPTGRRVVLVDKADRTQAQLRLGHLGPRYGDADTAALLLLETGFGGMFSSRLMQEIRVKRGWSYGAGCTMRRSRGRHWLEMWMATAIDVAGDAVRTTLDLYADLAMHGLPADELDLARAYLVGSMPFHQATARQRMQLAVRDAVFGLPADYTIALPARVADLGTADVTAAASRWLRPSEVVTVAVTTADAARERLAGAGAGPVTTVAFDSY